MLTTSFIGSTCDSRGNGRLVCVHEVLLREVAGSHEGGCSSYSVYPDPSQLLLLASNPLRPFLIADRIPEQTKIETPNIMSFLLAPLGEKKPTSADINMLEGDSQLIVVAGRLVYFKFFPHPSIFPCYLPASLFSTLIDSLATRQPQLWSAFFTPSPKTLIASPPFGTKS